MLGVNRNPRLGRADDVLREVAVDLGVPETFHPTDVGVYFNEGNEGTEVADPYFGGAGPTRAGCQHCARCMTGCPFNAKRSEEHTSELQSLMRISYAVFCLKKK